MAIQDNIISYSPGIAPGMDIRAGIAQVADFSPLVDRIYAPKITRLQSQIAQGEKEQLQRQENIATSLKKQASGILGRTPAIQSELNDRLQQAREDAAWLNKYNVDPTKPLPTAVSSRPEFIQRYQQFNKNMADINRLASIEKQALDIWEEGNKLVAKGESEWTTPSLLAQNRGLDKNAFRNKAIKEFGINQELWDSLPEDTRKRTLAEIDNLYDTKGPANITQEDLRLLKKVDVVKEALKPIKDVLGVEISESELANGSYIETLKEKGINPDQIQAAAINYYSPGIDESTTLGKQMGANIRNNNLLFDKEKSALLALSDTELSKAGVTREDLKNDDVVAEVFANYSVDGNKIKKDSSMLNPMTARPLRRYSSDYNGRQQYFTDMTVGILANKETVKKLRESDFAKEAQRAANKRTEREAIATLSSPMQVRFGEAVLATPYQSANLDKDIKRTVSRDTNAYVAELGKMTSELPDFNPGTIVTRSMQWLPIDKAGRPSVNGEEVAPFWIGTTATGETESETKYGEEGKASIAAQVLGGGKEPSTRVSRKPTYTILIPMSQQEQAQYGYVRPTMYQQNIVPTGTGAASGIDF